MGTISVGREKAEVVEKLKPEAKADGELVKIEVANGGEGERAESQRDLRQEESFRV